MGQLLKGRHPVISRTGRGRGTEYAVRLSYKIAIGRALPKKTYVLRKCKNGRCVNPKHLLVHSAPIKALSQTERFLAKVRRTKTCWLWRGTMMGGYGVLWVNGRYVRAHRFSYEQEHNVALDRREFICHACDNPICVRPQHLFVGNAQINALDAFAKGRNARATFSMRKAREMRMLRKQGVSRDGIARRYGTVVSTVDSILYKGRWSPLKRALLYRARKRLK